MATKKQYAVEMPDNDEVTPFIYRTEEEGAVIWREAKKQLRQWYLDQAKVLRSLSEADFVKSEESALVENENGEKVESVSNPG